MTNREKQIVEYLKEHHSGKSNAIHSDKLAAKFNITTRSLRGYVNKLRQYGQSVCSDKHGYWYAVSEKEIKQTVKHLNRFIGEVSSARTGLQCATLVFSGDIPKNTKVKITMKVS